MRPQPLHFRLSMIVYPLPEAHGSGPRTGSFFCFGEPAEGFGLSTCWFLCIVSLPVWGILSLVLGRGDFSHGLGVSYFSHEEVK